MRKPGTLKDRHPFGIKRPNLITKIQANALIVDIELASKNAFSTTAQTVAIIW